MRTGNYAVQQGLTSEAASIVKQAVTLAKRRGHAQVTPLHVASTMLGVTNGLLRNACLQSHSHPLQCKALELCFNVALNRLPASTASSSMLGGGAAHHHHHHHHHTQCSPSISNALVAAFKRAQAHQRRGSVENQQQPLLAVKIELEQLIISILDDPSVSRVMREAGFSSTQVKSNVEQAVSLEICSQNNNNNSTKENNDNILTLSPSSSSSPREKFDPVRDEDITSVVENLGSERKRSTVIVGECVASLESVVRRVMEKLDKGEVGETLRGLKFITLSLSSLGSFSREEVEKKIKDVKGLAKMGSYGKGCVLYVGDLKWVFDYRKGRGCYCPVDHMVMEIGKMVSGGVGGESVRFWVMGVATFQGYMRCKNGEPSLETLWGLHPITIPAGSLSLSLITHSGLQNEPTKEKADNNRNNWLLLEDDEQKQQSSACNSDSSTSSLPAWLQQYKNENKATTYNHHQECVPNGELCKKWNSMSPSSSTSGFSYEHQQQHSNKNSQISNHHNFWISESSSKPPNEPLLRAYIPESKSNHSSNPNSASSSDGMEVEYGNRYRELNSENMKSLCNALEKEVPWQRDIIPEIASTVLQCRSGMMRRKGKVMRNNNEEVKEETWLIFQGVDVEAKEKIAKELARLVFGSQNDLVSISLSSFADSTDQDCCRNKRSRGEQSYSYIERFADAIACNPHRVFLVEDIEQVDYCSQLGFKRAIGRGRVMDVNGEEVAVHDAIVILSCESFKSSRSRACSPNKLQKACEGCSQEEMGSDHMNIANSLVETSPSVALDLNISIDDDGDDYDEDQCVDDIGLLESVDRKIVFKFQDLYVKEKDQFNNM